jgi:hypothetical protein
VAAGEASLPTSFVAGITRLIVTAGRAVSRATREPDRHRRLSEFGLCEPVIM